MTTTFDLYGIPETPRPPLRFTKFVSALFAPVGTAGVGDPVSDPMTTLNYMAAKARLHLASAQQRPMVRLADKNLNIMAELIGEISGNTTEFMSDTGTANVVVTYDNWLIDWIVNTTRVDEDVHLIIDPTPTQRSWRTRWAGKVHQINIKRNEDGTSTAEIIALSMREHARKLLFAAMPFLMPEVQLPRMWIMPGPIRTALFITMFINLARLFVPGFNTVTNIFNPASWLNPLSFGGLFNFDPLAWPIQAAFVNPLLDQSRWTVIGATWTSWHDSTVDMLKDCGVIMRAYTWLKDEDTDSPYTELSDIITGGSGLAVDLLDVLGLGSAGELVTMLEGAAVETLAMPRRNCVVFALEDMSGQAGPTGTALDGLLNVVGVTLDDMFTTVLIDADTGQTLNGEPVIDVINPTAPIAQSLLGVAPKPPNVIWRESQYDKVVSKQHTLYKAPIKTMMIGGRSPAIVNQAQTFAIRYALNQIQTVVVAGLGGALGGPPIGAGLADLYQGQLDNVLFAWERNTNPERALWTGDLAYQELCDRGGQTAYTLATIISLRQADYNSRAYYGFQTQVVSGLPWVLDVDVRLGERAGWEFDGVIYVDQITAIQRNWSRGSPMLCNLSVGDDKDRQDPIARGLRAINAFYGLFTAFLGEGLLFG